MKFCGRELFFFFCGCYLNSRRYYIYKREPMYNDVTLSVLRLYKKLKKKKLPVWASSFQVWNVENICMHFSSRFHFWVLHVIAHIVVNVLCHEADQWINIWRNYSPQFWRCFNSMKFTMCWINIWLSFVLMLKQWKQCPRITY